AQGRFAEIMAALRVATGWEVAVEAGANQTALAALVREVLPPGWTVEKGPAIQRETRQVSVTVSSGAETRVALNAAAERFEAVSGWRLTAVVAARGGRAAPPVAAAPEGPAWEINAAYAEIKRALAGSTLYRTSLKGQEVVLGFISPQVGERYRDRIAALSARIGWRLAISPQANQSALAEAAQVLSARAGWTIVKGPSIYLERSEVAMTLAAAPDPAALAAAAAAFEAQTGFRLAVSGPAVAAAPAPSAPREDSVDVPVALIRLTAHQQGLALDAEKTRKAVERAQRAGRISPPVRLRRLRDGYLLLDGLYRLRAAHALGWERVAAVVE
ncbi:MAG: ParB N-terminal domain-containing protein, partial [Anaerolineales bacterium]|nr:ParB N-terminal domain-containing protein [Anaerolineales bacterium]